MQIAEATIKVINKRRNILHTMNFHFCKTIKIEFVPANSPESAVASP